MVLDKQTIRSRDEALNTNGSNLDDAYRGMIERIKMQNGEKAEMVPCSFFKRNEAKSHDYVCIPCGTRAVYHR